MEGFYAAVDTLGTIAILCFDSIKQKRQRKGANWVMFTRWSMFSACEVGVADNKARELLETCFIVFATVYFGLRVATDQNRNGFRRWRHQLVLHFDASHLETPHRINRQGSRTKSSSFCFQVRLPCRQ